jgi:3-hydroxymyristoyl/3-hydroxydecanoyl-(acyl carrier protein) dehydratase
MRNMSLFWCKALVEGQVAAEAELLCAEVAS